MAVPATPTKPVAPKAPLYTSTLRNAGKGFYRDTQGNLVSGNRMKIYTDRFNQWAGQYGGLKPEDARYNSLGTRLKDYGSKYGFDYNKVLGKNWKPYQAPAAPATPATPPAAPAPQEPAPPPIVGSKYTDYDSPMTRALMKAFGEGANTMQAYEPQNFEGSPLYQFQKQKGMADLEKLMAARGLTNSGAEIQANSDFLANINAQEAEKQRQYADQAAQRQQQALQFIANFDQSEKENLRNQWNTDLDRQQNISQFEATRGDRRQELAVNFLNSLLDRQSQNNIAALSQAGLNQKTALTQALMNAMAGFAANSGRGGGGGGGTPPPSRNADIFDVLTKYGDRAGNNDVLDGVLRTLFGGSGDGK